MVSYRLLWWISEEAQGGRRPDPLWEVFVLIGAGGGVRGGGAPWPAGTYVHGLGDHSCHARNILASKLGNQIFSFVFKRERRKPPHLYTEAVPRAGGRREVPGI